MTARPSTDPEQYAAPKAAVILTPGDVERLLHDDSADSRVEVLEKVSANYNTESFADREREIAEQIFRLLMKDAALQVREILSDRIKENPAIPRDIVLHMAHDVDSVALPMISTSAVLSDADLVNIVEASRDVGKLMAISQRPNVSSRVSDALVETHYPQVVSSLLTNEGADISTRALENIVNDFRGDPAVFDAMVERKSLPITLVERLITEASDAVARDLKQRYKLSDEQIARDTAGSRDDMMLRMLRHDLDESEVMELVQQMAAQDRLTHSLVMTALCRGQLSFFVSAMAHYAKIPYANALRLIADKGEHGFKGIYVKSGLPDTMFDAIRLILNVVQQLGSDEAVPGSLLYANRMVERILVAAGGRDVEYLPYFIALIRQNIHRH